MESRGNKDSISIISIGTIISIKLSIYIWNTTTITDLLRERLSCMLVLTLTQMIRSFWDGMHAMGICYLLPNIAGCSVSLEEGSVEMERDLLSQIFEEEWQ